LRLSIFSAVCKSPNPETNGAAELPGGVPYCILTAFKLKIHPRINIIILFILFLFLYLTNIFFVVKMEFEFTKREFDIRRNLAEEKILNLTPVRLQKSMDLLLYKIYQQAARPDCVRHSSKSDGWMDTIGGMEGYARK
jgi:hypothetical protein